MFNEVFFDDVFVPDDCLVGARARRLARRPHDARERARARWASGSDDRRRRPRRPRHGRRERAAPTTPLALDEVGELVATGHALAVLGFRLTLAALTGADPSGSEAAVRKLLGVEHDQRVQEVGLGLLGGGRARSPTATAAAWVAAFLFNRCLTIAGGTSEIQRNIIAERVLGLPRDPVAADQASRSGARAPRPGR